MSQHEFNQFVADVRERFERGGCVDGPTPCTDAGLHLLEIVEHAGMTDMASLIRAADLQDVDRVRAVLEALVDVEQVTCTPELREAWFFIGLVRQGVERELASALLAQGEVALAERVSASR